MKERALGGMSVEALMLARHKGLDALLARDIDSGAVTQVIELAAGLSPRGWRFTQRYGERITYVETDLPQMAARKRELLEKSALFGPRHRVVAVNALLDQGPESLDAVAATLDPQQGTAIVTEGLMSYLDPATAQSVWRRIARALGRFPRGVYYSDAYVRQDRYGLAMKIFRGAIQRVVRGRMHVHFEVEADAPAQLTAAGFREVRLNAPAHIAETRELAAIRGGDRVRILEARR